METRSTFSLRCEPVSGGMIISASRRTDIPALHGAWFMDKIARGFCEVKNPYNGQTSKVSLALPDVEGIVFWSRNYRPMIDNLQRIHGIGYRFYCQFTIIGYPKFIEPGSPSPAKAAETAHTLAKTFGPKTVVWRYDPIMLTSVTDAKWHLQNFSAALSLMEGATDTCVISFIDKYRKLKRNLFPLLKEHNAEYFHPSLEELTNLAVEMRDRAREKGIEVMSCCEPWLDPSLIAKTSCIDTGRLAHLSGGSFDSVKKTPTRSGCGCYGSRDIGAYDACVLGCAYCYANNSRDRSAANIKRIDKVSTSLTL